MTITQRNHMKSLHWSIKYVAGIPKLHKKKLICQMIVKMFRIVIMLIRFWTCIKMWPLD